MKTLRWPHQFSLPILIRGLLLAAVAGMVWAQTGYSQSFGQAVGTKRSQASAAQAAEAIQKSLPLCFSDQGRPSEPQSDYCMRTIAKEWPQFPEAEAILAGCSATSERDVFWMHRPCLYGAFHHLHRHSRPKSDSELRRWKAGLVLSQCRALPYRWVNPNFGSERVNDPRTVMSFRVRENCFTIAARELGLEALSERLLAECSEGNPLTERAVTVADCRERILREYREQPSR
jgi:hypothetical protein